MEYSDKKIDDSLVKLSGCMSSVYKQKLTSPKWNRFLGLKLRWRDKIRKYKVRLHLSHCDTYTVLHSDI